MADVLERDIREKAEERWKAIETERNQSKEVLTPGKPKGFRRSVQRLCRHRRPSKPP